METWHFLILVVIVNSAIWTYFDASRQRDAFHIGVGPDGRPPHTWASWVFLFLPAALPFYLRARSAALLAEPRPGPPPRFVAAGFTFFAVAIALVGLGVFAAFIVFGHFRLASIGLVITAAGLFGGRGAKLGDSEEGLGLGELGLEQVGFRPSLAEDADGDDAEIANVEEYFANLSAPHPNPPPRISHPAPTGPRQETRSAMPPSISPLQPPPASASVVAASEDPGAPRLAGKASSQPSLPPSLQPPEPAPGVPYQPPPVGVVYSPPAAGAAVHLEPPPPAIPPVDARATVALSEAAVAAELRGRLSAGPQSSPPAAHSPPTRDGGSPVAQRGGPAPPPAMPVAAPAPARAAASPQPSPIPITPSPAAPQPAGPSSVAPRPVIHQALVPPPPRKTTSPRPAGYGYAAAGGTRKPPWPRIAGALVVLLAVAATFFFIRPVPERVEDIQPEARGRPVVAPESDLELEEEETSPEPEEISEEGIEDPEQMELWLEDYSSIMGALAATIDEIDFDGIESDRCQALRRQIAETKKTLDPAPDSEIDQLISRAIVSFSEAAQACRKKDETGWALALLEGKGSTHEAQEMMDRRYLYRGVVELELESETGAERSAESISGRFLAASLP